jgi:hypothetical protein
MVDAGQKQDQRGGWVVYRGLGSIAPPVSYRTLTVMGIAGVISAKAAIVPHVKAS